MGNKYKEYTTKDGGLITPTHFKTTVVNTKTGEKGTGRDKDKRESISKAYKELREKQGK